MSNFNDIYDRMIETLKSHPLYQKALTVQQILDKKAPSEICRFDGSYNY